MEFNKSELQTKNSMSNLLCSHIRTEEEKREDERVLFVLDFGTTIIAWMGSVCSDIANNVASMIANSGRSERRDKTAIAVDYTKQKDVVAACNAIKKADSKYTSQLNALIRHLTAQSKGHGQQDTGEHFLSRIDYCDDFYKQQTEALRKAIYAVLKPLKCTDPLAFYPMMYALYMMTRFRVICNFLGEMDEDFNKKGAFYRYTKLDVIEPFINLVHRCQFQDKNGRTFKLLITKRERDEFDKEKQKKSWQIRNADNPPLELNLFELFEDDRIHHAVYAFGHELFRIANFDKIVTESCGIDPEYRHDYHMESLQACYSSFEQTMCFESIFNRKYKEMPKTFRAYWDYLKQKFPNRAKRRPVVCFTLVKADPKLTDTTERNIFCLFTGVWDSPELASIEIGIDDPKHITQSIQKHKGNDGHNRMWMSLSSYCIVLYKTMMENGMQEEATAFKRALHEVDFNKHDREQRRKASFSESENVCA